MGGFNEHLQEFKTLNADIVAASAESAEETAKIAAEVDFKVAFGVTHAQANELGSWWEDRRQIIQPSNFVLDDAGKVLSATYSSGPIGRVEPADALRFIQFMERQKTG